MFHVVNPKPSIGIIGAASVNALTINITILELALIGGTRGPTEPTFAHRLPINPIPNIHIPICPEVFALPIRAIVCPLACVDVPIVEDLLSMVYLPWGINSKLIIHMGH
nr:hypothetical protein Itr_chr09CG02110 [Ipomoea trifida]